MRILILGGTADGIELAKRISQLDGMEVLTSLAGRTQNPKIAIANTRIGGFGGIEGLREYLQNTGIEAVIDATHPFANQISHHAATATSHLQIPHLILVRPGWEQQPGDNWLEVDNWQEATQILAKVSKRVFLTIGRQEIGEFADLKQIWFLMRMIDPPTQAKIPPGEIILERGPFSLERDRDLMITYQIDHLVSKNSGGEATYGKIMAARELGIPVIMRKRPPIPKSMQVNEIESAINWLISLKTRE